MAFACVNCTYIMNSLDRLHHFRAFVGFPNENALHSYLTSDCKMKQYFVYTDYINVDSKYRLLRTLNNNNATFHYLQCRFCIFPKCEHSMWSALRKRRNASEIYTIRSPWSVMMLLRITSQPYLDPPNQNGTMAKVDFWTKRLLAQNACAR